MREYILTDKEKEIINRYLSNGDRLEGYTMLLSRVRNMGTVKSDLELIQKFLDKTEGKV